MTEKIKWSQADLNR